MGKCLRPGALTFSIALLYPSLAYAYVDPGLVSMVIQGIFAAVAGFATLYVVGPWKWFKSLFNRTGSDRDSSIKNDSKSSKADG